uniref:Fucolectin tachylectin-4 pentraxin-1 domain-containing protein n=1 Tax=Magallana gigas TaxID=29159 RepID=A0A8W8MQG3_MAGGI
MKRFIDILLEAREEAGVTQPYLFSRPGISKPYRGTDCIRKFCNLAQLQNSSNYFNKTPKTTCDTSSGLYTCRFRSGHANLTNATTQCELFENTTNKNCHNGALFGAQGPCEIILPNIALRKPAEQSSTHLDYNAAYAVDGNRGTDLAVDKCTITGDGDTNPWWRVDLQAVYSITSVRILNRGIDNSYGTDMSFRLQDVTVTVGLTESDINTPCGFFAGPDFNYKGHNCACMVAIIIIGAARIGGKKGSCG